MTPELLSLLAGGASGFVMKLIASQQGHQQRMFEQSLKAAEVADVSADKAANRGGVWMRRFIVVSVMLAVVYFPLLISFQGGTTTIETERAPWDLFGIFTGGFEEVKGYLIMPEVRTAVLAIIGFYFGQGTIRSK